MVKQRQYGHFLYKQVLGGNSVQDGDGNWVTPAPSWELHSNCREETNGKGHSIQGSDGKALVFSSLILLPKGATKVSEGTVIRVTETEDPEGPLRIEKAVEKCDISSMHGRIWV